MERREKRGVAKVVVRKVGGDREVAIGGRMGRKGAMKAIAEGVGVRIRERGCRCGRRGKWELCSFVSGY